MLALDRCILNTNNTYSKLVRMVEAKRPRLCVLGSGKGSNYLAINEAIETGVLHAEIVLVLSDVQNSGILQHAQRLGHKALYLYPGPKRTVLDKAQELQYVDVIKQSAADLVILAGFMRVLKSGFLREFPNRVLNIHPSLLPNFRGLRAWEQALKAGVNETGCTVHVVTEELDAGPIVLQATVPVLPDDTAESLHARIQKQEHNIYPKAIEMYWKQLNQAAEPNRCD